MSSDRLPVPRAERIQQITALRDEGHTTREIAEILNVSPSTVRNSLSDPDGLKQLRRRERYRGRCETCGSPTDGSAGLGTRRATALSIGRKAPRPKHSPRRKPSGRANGSSPRSAGGMTPTASHLRHGLEPDAALQLRRRRAVERADRLIREGVIPGSPASSSDSARGTPPSAQPGYEPRQAHGGGGNHRRQLQAGRGVTGAGDPLWRHEDRRADRTTAARPRSDRSRWTAGWRATSWARRDARAAGASTTAASDANGALKRDKAWRRASREEARRPPAGFFGDVVSLRPLTLRVERLALTACRVERAPQGTSGTAERAKSLW